jgi:hypothetical protein
MVKRFQNKDLDAETTIFERFVSGAAAGFISQTAVYPLDVNDLNSCTLHLLSLSLLPV